MSILPVESKRYLRLLFIFIVVLGCLFLGVFMIKKYYYLSKLEVPESFVSTAEKSEAYIKIKRECGDQKLDDCIKKGDILKKYSLSEVYDFLGTSIAQSEINSFNCHILSHYIGGFVYEREAGLENVLKIDLKGNIKDSNCITGFYHGAMIKSVGKNKNPIKELQEVLEDVKLPKSLIDQDMVHGVGHALFAHNGDMRKSLDVCREISKNEVQEYLCTSGVFMESFFESNEVGLKNEVKICLGYENKERFACMASYVENNYFKQSFEEDFFPICQSLEGDMQSVCIEKMMLNLFSMGIGISEKTEIVKNMYVIAKEEKTKLDILVFSSKFVNTSGDRSKTEPIYCYLGNVYQFLKCKKIYKKWKNEIIFLPKTPVLSLKLIDLLQIF
jgi:hypothetical protein